MSTGATNSLPDTLPANGNRPGRNRGGRNRGAGNRGPPNSNSNGTPVPAPGPPAIYFTSTGSGVVAGSSSGPGPSLSQSRSEQAGSSIKPGRGGRRRNNCPGPESAVNGFGSNAGGRKMGRDRGAQDTGSTTIRVGGRDAGGPLGDDGQNGRNGGGARRNRRPKIPLSEVLSLAGTPGPHPDSENGGATRPPPQPKWAPPPASANDGIEDLTSSLIEGLCAGDYECMICYDSIKGRDHIWSCHTCWAVFHLKCIGKWGQKSAEDKRISTNNGNNHLPPVGWRCPGCQHLTTDIPTTYRCFCDKAVNPSLTRYLVPHTCGQTCGRDRGCTHMCTMQCHPGPCRPCEALAPAVKCYCGKSSFVVRCTELANVTFSKSCGDVCGDVLTCGQHRCEALCHDGPCQPCPITIEQSCNCGKTTRERPCGSPFEPMTCKLPCNIPFACGKHVCTRICHDPTNHPDRCSLDPAAVVNCPCGSKSVDFLTKGKGRQTCSDPIPTCDSECNKVLSCGHRCQLLCHTGECPRCEEILTMTCRCGKSVLETPCPDHLRDEETGTPLPPLCDRPCKAWRHCKRHRCNDKCCDIQFHVCEAPCGKMLKCGKHPCIYPCGHPGRCHDCMVGVSFDELACSCGRTRMFPPIPCNTPPPICTYPCTKQLECGHAFTSEHNCHPDSEPCPPCVVFVERPCACGKRTMKNIPCSRQGVPSCGEMCNKTLPSCGHPCLRFCHAGECADEEHKCSARCGRVRSVCGHVCLYPCHGTSYCAEDRSCNEKIRQKCLCGHRIMDVTCNAWKENLGQGTNSLPCDESCAITERNRKLAEALEIDVDGGDSGDGSDNLDYSSELLHYARQNPVWAKGVEKALAAFIEEDARRTLHMPPAKAASNNFTHALAAHYHLSAQIVDPDRKGSVILRKTAADNPSIPSLLVTTAAASYRSNNASSSGNATLARSISSIAVGRVPMNALHISSLQFGMDSRDVKIMIEPMCGSDVSLAIKRLTDHDVVVIFQPPTSASALSSTRRITPEDIEALLVAIEPDVRTKFVGNSWAKEVKCCWVTPEGEVCLGQKPKMSQTVTPTAARAAYAATLSPDLAMVNSYDVLEVDEAGFSTVKKRKKPVVAVVVPAPVVTTPEPAIPRPPTPEAWDEALEETPVEEVPADVDVNEDTGESAVETDQPSSLEHVDV
ncbi:hypothetical protein DFS34DRAFT_604207 [Phlyctochytrium arcticum]|nr:hypothetical protein DFS34DRAFT_604207 [Phlyctochytrium arcticum]